MDSLLEQQDEDVRIAVRALGDMRKFGTSTSGTTATKEDSVADSSYLGRVSNLPLVNTAIRAYEHGKASSRVVKYGAEMMESGVKRATSYYMQPQDKDKDRDMDSQSSPAPADLDQNKQLSAPRSQWQTVLVEAGGLSAALSDESLRRLQYCLSCLQAATNHIDQQIVVLRDLTDSLQRQLSSTPMTVEQREKLDHIRRDIVNTVRQAVDIVSKYTGGSALPEHARRRVKGFILSLPKRWADKSGVKPKERDVVVAASGRAGSERRHLRYTSERGIASENSSRAASPLRSRASSVVNGHSPSSSISMAMRDLDSSSPPPLRAAMRVLTLATESLDMMRGVTGVVKDTLDRADAWVGRLKSVRRGGYSNDMDVDQNMSPVEEETPEYGHGYGYDTDNSTVFSHSRRASASTMGDYFNSYTSASSRSSAIGTPLPIDGVSKMSIFDSVVKKEETDD